MARSWCRDEFARDERGSQMWERWMCSRVDQGRDNVQVYMWTLLTNEVSIKKKKRHPCPTAPPSCTKCALNCPLHASLPSMSLILNPCILDGCESTRLKLGTSVEKGAANRKRKAVFGSSSEREKTEKKRAWGMRVLICFFLNSGTACG